MAGPKRDPEIAKLLDPNVSDEINEPSANREEGWNFKEPIPNAFFNWLGQTWGRWILSFANTGQRFFNPSDAVEHPQTEVDSTFFLDTRVNEAGELDRFGSLGPPGVTRSFEVDESNYIPFEDSKPIAADGRHVLICDQAVTALYIVDMRADQITKITGFPAEATIPAVVTNGQKWGMAVEMPTSANTRIYTSEDYQSPTEVSDLSVASIDLQMQPEDAATVGLDAQLQWVGYDGADSHRFNDEGTILQTYTGEHAYSIAGIPLPSAGTDVAVSAGTDTVFFGNIATYNVTNTGTQPILVSSTPNGFVAVTGDPGAGNPTVHFFPPKGDPPAQYEWTIGGQPTQIAHDGRYVYISWGLDRFAAFDPLTGLKVEEVDQVFLGSNQIRTIAINGAYAVVAASKQNAGEESIYIVATNHASRWRWASTPGHSHLGQHAAPVANAQY